MNTTGPFVRSVWIKPKEEIEADLEKAESKAWLKDIIQNDENHFCLA